MPPGTVVGKYTLLRRLAVGGMAEIYLARTVGIEGFQKDVVLKRILPQLASDDAIVGMFLQEARLAATLSHPNIVQVHEMGLAGGSYFFTMEYVPGIDVRAVFRDAGTTGVPIPIEHVVAIGAAAAAGLHHAHEQKASDGRPLCIVHRDISPSNLLIGENGVVKVVDFGIAKAAVGHAETRTGSMKGKISYMSPEQCRGLALDRRSDIFSLGVVLHELVTGKRLFAQASDFDAMTRIVSHDVALPSLSRADCPRALDDIILRCMARNSDLRFSTAQALQLELEGYARHARLDISTVALGAYVRGVRRPDASSPIAIAAAPIDAPTGTIDAKSARPPEPVRSAPSHPTAPGPRDEETVSARLARLASVDAPVTAMDPAPMPPRSRRAVALLGLGVGLGSALALAFALRAPAPTPAPAIVPAPLAAPVATQAPLAPLPQQPPVEPPAPEQQQQQQQIAERPNRHGPRDPRDSRDSVKSTRHVSLARVAQPRVQATPTAPLPKVTAPVPPQQQVAKPAEKTVAKQKPDLDSWYAQ